MPQWEATYAELRLKTSVVSGSAAVIIANSLGIYILDIIRGRNHVSVKELAR